MKKKLITIITIALIAFNAFAEDSSRTLISKYGTFRGMDASLVSEEEVVSYENDKWLSQSEFQSLVYEGINLAKQSFFRYTKSVTIYEEGIDLYEDYGEYLEELDKVLETTELNFPRTGVHILTNVLGIAEGIDTCIVIEKYFYRGSLMHMNAVVIRGKMRR